MNDLLPQNRIDEFRAKAATIEHPRELIVDALRAVQSHYGWVPDAGVDLVAELLGVLPVEVEEIATFYDKIYRRPVGKRVIHICDSICCWAAGGEELATHLQRTLGIGFGETTADGVFTLLPTCCLGACGEAPAMMVGLTTYGSLTAAKVDTILAQLRTETGA
ncbi:MAG: NADH-quinone oxidoreductase subunit NuoE [Desulfuromonas sp.]|nr:NADH-quinone oxidoreductase subunit NuoE [Desulfuromonas sp.]